MELYTEGQSEMKEDIQTKTGKPFTLPARMFRQKDLDEMQIGRVDNHIFFNVTNYGHHLPEISDSVKSHMLRMDYVDCSMQTFTVKKLARVVKQEIDADGDLIPIPCFKDESEADIIKKIELAWNLKAHYNKEIVFVVSYKANSIIMQKIIDNANAFDYLAIFYGVHYGRLPSLSQIHEKVLSFKIATGKRVFCFAVPLMFAWDTKGIEPFLFPVWFLISDGWIKNWKSGGSKNDIRIVDYQDLKNKTELGWYRTGHTTDETIQYVSVTVKSLFEDRQDMEVLRENYKRMLTDEILQEVMSLTPFTIEQYIAKRFSPIYYNFIISLYKEKILQIEVANADWIMRIPEEDRKRLITELRQHYRSVERLEVLITEIKSMVLIGHTMDDLVILIENF